MKPTKRAQIAIFFTVFVDLLGFGIVIPILPLYAKAVSEHPSAWMTGINDFLAFSDPGAFWAGVAMWSFSLMQFLATPVLGRLSDLVGRRPVLWISLMGSFLGYLILGLTGRMELVLAARILDGITGGNISVAQAAMADTSAPSERSKVMGMIGAAFGLGFVLGPGLAGILSGSALGTRLYAEHGWHLPFLAAAGLSLLSSLLVLLWLPETLPAEARSRAREDESRGHALVRALRIPGMPQILVTSLLAMGGFSMMEGTYSLLARGRFHLTESHIGYLFMFVGLLIVLYQGGLVRVVAKRIPERVALLTGLGLMGLSLLLLPTAPWKWPFLLVMVPLAWGSGMNTTAANALASQITPADEQGGLFGVLNAISGVGRILGPLIGTTIFARRGHVAAYHTAAAVMAVAFLLALTLPRRDRTAQPDPR